MGFWNTVPGRPKRERQPGSESRDWALRTRTVEEPTETASGFPEIYYCTKCELYFGLAWHEKTGASVPGSSAVDPRRVPSTLTPGAGSVFCPNCSTDYSIYGAIPKFPEAGVRPFQVHEHATGGFPSNQAAEEHERLRAADLTFERCVVLVSGEIPDGYDLLSFGREGLHHTFPYPDHEGGCPQDVLRLDRVSSESDELDALLRSEVFEPTTGTRLFLSVGPMELPPPVGELVICLVVGE